MRARIRGFVASTVPIAAGAWGTLWCMQLFMLGLYGARFGWMEYALSFASLALLSSALYVLRASGRTAYWVMTISAAVVSAAGILGIARALFGWGPRSHYGYGYRPGLGFAAFQDGAFLEAMGGTVLSIASLALAVRALKGRPPPRNE